MGPENGAQSGAVQDRGGLLAGPLLLRIDQLGRFVEEIVEGGIVGPGRDAALHVPILFVGKMRGEVAAGSLGRCRRGFAADGLRSGLRGHGGSLCDRLRGGRRVPAPYVSDMLMQAVRAGDSVLLGKSLHNDLQAAALTLRPALRQVLELGEEYGAFGSIVSGSGPTCAFVARDDEHALDLAVALTASGVCRTVKRGIGPVAGAKIVG